MMGGADLREQVVELDIERMAFGAEGIAHLPNGKVVFVTGGFPGERVLARVTDDRKGFARAEVAQVVSPHPSRVEPGCKLQGSCGGCQFWALPYAQEWAWTSEAALDAFGRTSKLALPATVERFASPTEARARRRLRLKVGADGQTGFHEAGTHRLCAVPDCLVAHQALLAARDELAPALPGGEGHLLLELDADGGSVVALWQTDHQPRALSERVAALLPKARHLKGVRLAPLEEDGSNPQRRIDVGDPRFTIRVDGLPRVLEVGAFTQANEAINDRLVQHVTELLDPTPRDSILELYCGAGNFSLSLARLGAGLLGLELSQAAVDAARLAARQLTLAEGQRLAFQRRDLSFGIGPLRERFSAALLDPPRTGAKPVMRELVQMAPARVAYVSCDPPTLGRDAATLAQHGWRLARLAAFDMFPRTYHVEMAALFVR